MEVLWRCTTNENRWEDKGYLKSEKFNSDKVNKETIEINSNIYYQTLDEAPWGGCFADRGYMAMSRLKKEQRTEILKALFTDDGLGLKAARLPLGNSDYSDMHKSYNEHADDFNMEHFSISTDDAYLLPYIKEAMEICPDITFFSTPWSPPSWMKNNGCIHGMDKNNTIKFTSKYLKAYALYFIKYIEAYKNLGINISEITPQNEPTMNTAYASCAWTGAQLNEFIRDYLYPALRDHRINTKIWLGTFTDSQKTLCMPAINDDKTINMIEAVCFQWWGAPLAHEIYRKYKNLKLIQSETKCGNGRNDWKYAEEQFDCFKEFLNAGVNRYYLWNMVLDENGENTAENPWHQNAPITVNSQTNEILYNPSYYLTKHFSYYIKGGAKRIRTGGTYEDKIAFRNPDGENVLAVKNSTDEDITVVINWNGEMITPTIPAHSINTFCASGIDADTEEVLYQDNNELVKTRIRITNVKTGRLLSVDNSEILLLDNRGEKYQIWEIDKIENSCYTLVNFSSMKALAASDIKIIQEELNNKDSQKWILVPSEKDKEIYYKIKNQQNGKFLAEDGQRIVQDDMSDTDAQLWDVILISGDFILY